MRPVNLMAPTTLTQTFDLTSVSFLGSLIIEQKLPKPSSAIKNITRAFDLPSWILLILSLISLGMTFYFIAILSSSHVTVSIINLNI